MFYDLLSVLNHSIKVFHPTTNLTHLCVLIIIRGKTVIQSHKPSQFIEHTNTVHNTHTHTHTHKYTHTHTHWRVVCGECQPTDINSLKHKTQAAILPDGEAHKLCAAICSQRL